jgi:predicted nuclease of predicted toxin-antitoxin system
MRIKVDEDLPRALVELLREMGFEADRVIDQGMSGWEDVDLFRAIQPEGMFLITADKDFGDIRHFPPGTHSGILLLRPDKQGFGPVLFLMREVLSAHDLESLRGTLTVATPRGIRVRRTGGGW